jgi:NAD(P)-dependent dehydrogenase (short-subunit alcohol dehydrogenase family)
VISLEGRHIVVIGGGSGLGLAAAQLAVQLGARVVVGDVNPRAAESVRELGSAASFALCDARDPAQADRLLAHAAQELGDIDGVLTTVGGARLGPIDGLDLDAWNAEVAFNLTSAYVVCRSALSHLQRRGGGAIVTTSSGYAVLAGPDRMAYTAAKAGVIAFTRSFAKEAARHGVRANCIAPGPIDTPRFREMNGGDEGVERVRRSMPLGSIPTPTEVAKTAIFLLSEAAAPITGQVIHVNGGLLMP